jgi:hypothetical protein
LRLNTWHPASAAPSIRGGLLQTLSRNLRLRITKLFFFTYGGELQFAYSMPRNHSGLRCVENRSRHNHKGCQNLDWALAWKTWMLKVTPQIYPMLRSPSITHFSCNTFLNAVFVVDNQSPAFDSPQSFLCLLEMMDTPRLNLAYSGWQWTGITIACGVGLYVLPLCRHIGSGDSSSVRIRLVH